MSFRAQSGRILVTRPDGSTALDSDGRMFQGTDRLRGTITAPARVATCNNGNYANVNADVDHAISAINAAADTVVGSFKVTSVSNLGVANLGWFNASGSYMHYLYGGTAGSGLAFYTFLAKSGQLVLNERVFLQAALSTSQNVTTRLTLVSIVIQYNLFCGSFV